MPSSRGRKESGRSAPPTSAGPGAGRESSRVERRFVLPVDIELAFELLSDPKRLDSLTPSWFGLEVRSDLPTNLRVGTTIDYRLTWRRVRMRWRSAITEWRPPERLTYEQVRGPYRSFRHVHLFEPTIEGTRITDRIDFLPPFGLLLRPVVAAELERILDFRIATATALVASSVG